LNSRIELYLATRADALRRGDRSVYREMTYQLERLGWVEPEPAPVFPPLDPAALARVHAAPVEESPMETTVTEESMEHAVPPAPKKRGRPPKPRCEHGKLVGRCLDCEEEI